ncbi:MAG: hypothetical protein IJ228_05560 [Succinivibrio sp.]|nr:hypothetical protein [Succinivibrio sp.]
MTDTAKAAKTAQRKLIAVNLTPQTYENFKAYAKARGVGMSSIASQLICEQLSSAAARSAHLQSGSTQAILQDSANRSDSEKSTGAAKADFSVTTEKSSHGFYDRSTHHLCLDRPSLSLLRMHAEALGLSPSRTLRYLVCAALRHLPLMSGPELTEINRAGYELSRLAVNLNELTHHGNWLALEGFDRDEERRLLKQVLNVLEPLEQFTHNYAALLDSLIDIARSRWDSDEELPEFSVVTENEPDSQQGSGA